MSAHKTSCLRQLKDEFVADWRRPMDSTDWLFVLMLPILLAVPLSIILVGG